MSAPPRLAALETATAATAVGLGDHDDDDVEVVADRSRRHTEALAPCLAQLLEARGWSARDLDAVVVDVGPGLFTGLRVGVATAKGLAVATGAGLVAVSSTDVLAETARAAGVVGPLAAVVDVRRGEVAWAAYELSAHAVTRAGEPALTRPEVLAALLGTWPRPPTAVGDGARRHREVLGPALAALREDLDVPSPAAALRLARRRLADGEAPAAHGAVHPAYVREADAVANFGVRGRS